MHDKYAISLAAIILFLVGAPLGAIIRKGGFGYPVVIALIMFLTYHFVGTFAKNAAEDGSMNPFIGSWVSNILMLPNWYTVDSTNLSIIVIIIMLFYVVL